MLFVFHTNVTAQKSLFCCKVGLPNNFGNTFYSEWDGVINVGFKFSSLRKENLYLNVYFNYDRLNDARYDWDTKQNLYKIGLGLQYKLRDSRSVMIFPQFGLGYVYQNLKNDRFGSSTDNSGINILAEIDLLYKLTGKFNIGIGLRYDFVRLAVPDYGSDSQIHTLTPTAQLVVEI